MNFPTEVLLQILAEEKVQLVFPNVKATPQELVETRCCQVLHRIKAILENDDFDDFECVERIVCIFGEIGTEVGSRHDFG